MGDLEVELTPETWPAKPRPENADGRWVRPYVETPDDDEDYECMPRAEYLEVLWADMMDRKPENATDEILAVAFADEPEFLAKKLAMRKVEQSRRDANTAREGTHDRVIVRRQWNAYRQAGCDFDALSGFRWDRLSGGVRALAPQPFVHAYVSCESIDGDIAHSCRHGRGPHWIKVCIVKKDNSRTVFERILAIVGPKPK